MLLGDGPRWTCSGDVDGFYPYSKYVSDRPSRTVVTSKGRKELCDVASYLPALVELGVLSQDEVRAFKTWIADEMDARYRKEHLARLRSEAGQIGAEVVERVCAQ